MVEVYKKLWSKPEFFLNMVGKVLECFSNVAYLTFFPKFVELHFRMTATQANMTSGESLSLSLSLSLTLTFSFSSDLQEF